LELAALALAGTAGALAGGAAAEFAALPADLGPRYFTASARIRLGLLMAACGCCGGTPAPVSAL
jgi:hypothetical protein